MKKRQDIQPLKILNIGNICIIKSLWIFTKST